ncbi:hypothetical protein V6N13_031069 [Hibiscus sabdariffa]|uniref:Hydroxyproline-rich glycoprotein family protein n=1 Tax=Hibiscus sabdariffa TaxID=183260 RepID=A0ABR2CLG3_9ROSI
MRGTIGRTLSNPNIQYLASLTKRTPLLLQSSPFSSGDGRGRGRGGGNSPFGGFTSAIGKSDSEDKRRDSNESPSVGLGQGRGGGNSPFGGFTSAIEKSNSEDKRRDSSESPPVGLGHGRGRGTPLSSEPKLPSFSSHVSQNGSGRGRGTNEPVPPPRQPKVPIFIMKQDEIEADSSANQTIESIHSSEPTLSSRILSAESLFGAGQGKPTKQPEPVSQMKEKNRHIRTKHEQQQPPPSPPVSKEEAVKKAMDILSRRREGDERGDMSMNGGRGSGRGGRGRGRGAQRGRGRGQEGYTKTEEEAVKEIGDDLYLGDNGSGEKLAETIGAENMARLVEGFEDFSSRVLPSPHDDAYLEAMHTNFMIEFEPEYLMADFESNPDIDEKPPMSLRDALEKVKPFLMSYEGIQNQEEWEEAIKETMDNVPLLQEIIDYYSGPDRVTAKKQQEELERVAKTLPKSAPASVKNFTNRAVLSLQSNPGWGFDKKCQFMDKLVSEVSQQYK